MHADRTEPALNAPTQVTVSWLGLVLARMNTFCVGANVTVGLSSIPFPTKTPNTSVTLFSPMRARAMTEPAGAGLASVSVTLTTPAGFNEARGNGRNPILLAKTPGAGLLRGNGAISLSQPLPPPPARFALCLATTTAEG